MSENIHVLVVDDSKVSRIMSTGLLRKLLPGVQIDEASNTDEARAVLASKPVQWLLLDHNMPGMTGLDLAESLRVEYPALRIALLTANVQETIQSRAAAIAIDFFRKPISEAVLKQIIEKLSGQAAGASA
ncbi:MAG: hypothetical protein RIS44_511 [Pseudomonadota bacterium]